MAISNLTLLFTFMDFIAVGVVMVAWLGIGWCIEHPGTKKPSVTVMMSEYRRQWMLEFSQRDVRIFDAQILASLRQGTAFFASSSLLAIGGLLALIGSPDQIGGFAMSISDATPSPIVYQIKLMFAGIFVIFAFLKFVWANRLFGYCAVVMGAVPNDPNHPDTGKQAALAGELNVRAALNFNRGLRAMYFALTALMWVLGAWALIVAALATGWVLWSREFLSFSRQLLENRTK